MIDGVNSNDNNDNNDNNNNDILGLASAKRFELIKIIEGCGCGCGIRQKTGMGSEQKNTTFDIFQINA